MNTHRRIYIYLAGLLLLFVFSCERTVFPDTPPPKELPELEYQGNNVFLENYFEDEDDDDVGDE